MQNLINITCNLSDAPMCYIILLLNPPNILLSKHPLIKSVGTNASLFSLFAPLTQTIRILVYLLPWLPPWIIFIRIHPTHNTTLISLYLCSIQLLDALSKLILRGQLRASDLGYYTIGHLDTDYEILWIWWYVIFLYLNRQVLLTCLYWVCNTLDI